MLSVENISFSVGHYDLLKGVTFDSCAGELTAILGANGAGKSTLLKTITGEIIASTGIVTIEGVEVNAWKPHELAQFRAVLAQQTPLALPFRVEEVVMMGRYPHFVGRENELDRKVVKNAMMKAGVDHLATRTFTTLSGGEQQRVHLARVFAQVWYSEKHETRYLILDEPINSLDVQYQHKTLQLAREFMEQGNVVVAVLHDINLAAQYADKMLLLKNGKQLAFGSTNKAINAKLLQECFDIPAVVASHPIENSPAAFFSGKRGEHGAIPSESETSLTPSN